MIRAISLALLCAASFGAVYWATAPDEPELAAPATVGSLSASPAPAAKTTPAAAEGMTFELRPGTAAPSSAAETSGQAASAQAASGAEEAVAARHVRNVTPDDMTAAPPLTGPLTRVEPPREEPAPARQEARMERVFNPVAVAAGALDVGGHKIRLAGIAVTEPGAKCGEGTAAWPCGRMARAALRSFLRRRAIECEVPAGADAIPDPARCMVGGEDIAAWLVAQGWARRSGDNYAEQADAARELKLGLFADARPDLQADEVAARR